MSGARRLTRPALGLAGPLLPQRGGIAQHTTMLHRALRRQAKVRTVGLARGYPLWLYPGQSNLEPGYGGHREPGVSYLIDPMAPMSWQRAARCLANANVDALVLVWWNAFWAPALGVLASAMRRRGTPLLFMCHNVLDHEATRPGQALARAVLGLGDAFVVHTEAQRAALEELVGARPISVAPHPVYQHFPPPSRRLPRRAQLELLYFGFVRPYKGIDLLAGALPLLGDQDFHLTVAGEWWLDDDASKQALLHHPRVEVLDRYLDEDEVAGLFDRADAVVLPYRGVTGSGVVPLAYNYGKPVIATDLDGLRAVVEDQVSGLLVRPDDPAALAQAVRAMAASSQDWRFHVESVRARMTWRGLAGVVLETAAQAGPAIDKCV